MSGQWYRVPVCLGRLKGERLQLHSVMLIRNQTRLHIAQGTGQVLDICRAGLPGAAGKSMTLGFNTNLF